MNDYELGATHNKQTLSAKPPRRQGKRLPQYIATLSVSLGALATGTVQGWTGNITDELQNGNFNNIDIDSSDIKWIGSCATLGSMVMCFPNGIISEKLGRKVALLIIAALFICGWLFIVFANCTMMINIGRFITGMGSGAFLIMFPVYVSEIAEKEIRGALIIMAGYTPFGITLVYVLGYAVDAQLCTIIVTVAPFLFMIAMLFQSETPLYRIKQGKEAEARSILIRLRGDSYDVDTELKEIKAVIEEDRKNQSSFKDSLMKSNTKKALGICFSLMFFQQGGGFKAVLFYTSNIFQSSGAELDPKISTIIIGIVQIIAVVFGILVIDKLGRRIVLLLSGAVMALGLIIIGAFFTLSERQLVSLQTLSNLGFMPLLGLVLFNIAFAVGYGALPWMMCAELLPPEIKGMGTAAASTFSWLIAFLVTNLYFDIKMAIGGDSTFYVFAAICILSVVFVFFVVPETKGRSLYQIQMELSGRKHQIEGVENKGFELKSISSQKNNS
ncbi:hypothetical protein ILUMI_22919 [Ignelater luminosus]|uniref:Major facilitator superfamily (MFS) profile domain-containing protein n=1 Tax=Ignelater luminosus TaxID=2038154 RepID=A0A8K0CBU6_IGNLU|nr:hypothetical protein ILUMI_22919 [Ignelater luminosus]